MALSLAATRVAQYMQGTIRSGWAVSSPFRTLAHPSSSRLRTSSSVSVRSFAHSVEFMEMRRFRSLGQFTVSPETVWITHSASCSSPYSKTSPSGPTGTLTATGSSQANRSRLPVIASTSVVSVFISMSLLRSDGHWKTGPQTRPPERTGSVVRPCTAVPLEVLVDKGHPVPDGGLGILRGPLHLGHDAVAPVVADVASGPLVRDRVCVVGLVVAVLVHVSVHPVRVLCLHVHRSRLE